MLKYFMKKLEIIESIKNHYNRDLRKQVVKTILAEEKNLNKPNYQVMNEIFKYVLNELNWKIADNIKEWDHTPFDIIEETFPKIESTKWFNTQILTAKKLVEEALQNQ